MSAFDILIMAPYVPISGNGHDVEDIQRRKKNLIDFKLLGSYETNIEIPYMKVPIGTE
jgi:hypothetical protein